MHGFELDIGCCGALNTKCKKNVHNVLLTNIFGVILPVFKNECPKCNILGNQFPIPTQRSTLEEQLCCKIKYVFSLSQPGRWPAL